MSLHIAVVEDEPDIREVITYNLEREGFRVSSWDDGEEAFAGISEECPDLALLDLMMPGLNGLELCQKLRLQPETKTLPIIMVTAKGEESDVVLGLGVGADDYMVKPFSPRELVARVRSQLRRADMAGSDNGTSFTIAGLSIDVERHEVSCKDEEGVLESLILTSSEFRLLVYLARHPGRVFRRDELLDSIVGDRAIVIDRNVDVHIRSIRKKLGQYASVIETIRGVGYKFTDKK